MKRYLSEVEVLYQDIRRLKHDMGNHVVILENLFQKDLHQEAMGYLLKLETEFHETAEELKTGNPVTDVIIMEKEKEAARKGIAFCHDFHFPEGSAIDVFDISVILSNALNNAIEGAASCQDSYINVSSYHKKNVYMIEFRNNFNGKLIFSEKDRLPVTSKEDQKEHGYGLSSIRKVARKYFGDMEIEQNGKEFLLYVMLMLK